MHAAGVSSSSKAFQRALLHSPISSIVPCTHLRHPTLSPLQQKPLTALGAQGKAINELPKEGLNARNPWHHQRSNSCTKVRLPVSLPVLYIFPRCQFQKIHKIHPPPSSFQRRQDMLTIHLPTTVQTLQTYLQHHTPSLQHGQNQRQETQPAGRQGLCPHQVPQVQDQVWSQQE